MLIKRTYSQGRNVLRKGRQFIRNAVCNPMPQPYEPELLRHVGRGIAQFLSFDFSDFKSQTRSYLSSLKTKNGYKYAASTSRSNMYAEAFASLIQSLLGTSTAEGQICTDRLNQFQCEDGFWRDGTILNEIFEDSDWWGARHFALIGIGAYSALGLRPSRKIQLQLQCPVLRENFLDNVDWGANGDTDNFLMNVGGILQFNREAGDKQAGITLDYLKDGLIKRINPETGMWGPSEFTSEFERSR